MNKTAVIVIGCATLALIWVLYPSNASDIAAETLEIASSRPGHFRRTILRDSDTLHDDETRQPALDAPVSEYPVADGLACEATDLPETFWMSVPEQLPASDTPEPAITLDQFDRPYTTTMTEAGFAELSPADKSRAIDEIVDTLRQARHGTSQVHARAEADIACGNYERAEVVLISEFERLGEFNSNEQGLYLTRIMGISLQQTTLERLETLYGRTGDHLGSEMARQRWHDLEAQKRHMQAAQADQAG